MKAICTCSTFRRTGKFHSRECPKWSAYVKDRKKRKQDAITAARETVRAGKLERIAKMLGSFPQSNTVGEEGKK